MLTNGVDKKYRKGDCLKQSLAFLLKTPADALPNWHKYPVSTWKLAFSSWLEASGYLLRESKEHSSDLHIAIFRLGLYGSDDLMPLHAVVCSGSQIMFDTLAGLEDKVYLKNLVKTFHIQKRAENTVNNIMIEKPGFRGYNQT